MKDPAKVAMGKRNKRKGSRQELRTVHLLEAIGYSCCKAGGSLGAWDIVAVHPTHVRLVQVKSNRPPGAAEMETLRAFRAPPGASKEVWVWRDREKRPVVEIL